MPEYKKLLSEAAVGEFIEAVKVITEITGGIIRVNPRDEAMIRGHLVAQPIDGKGIRVDIGTRRADIRSSRFDASWSRR